MSELCYILDGNNLTRLLTYFAGKTITIPTEDEFQVLTNALLLYQYINIDGKSFTDAINSLTELSNKQKDKVRDLYLEIIPIMNNYNINREQMTNDGRH